MNPASAAFIERTIQLIVFAYPILFLSVRGGMSVCAVLLVISSLASLTAKGRPLFANRRTGDVAFVGAMALPFIATLISQAQHGSFDVGSWDNPSRFLLAVPIYALLRTEPPIFGRALEYGAPLGAWAGLLTSLFFPSVLWRMKATYFTDPAMFAAAILALGVLSIGSINWRRKDRPAIIALKMSGFLVGVFCVARSMERGIWMAVPIVILIWALYRFPMRRTVAIVALTIAGALASYWLVPAINARVDHTRTEVASILRGNMDTSIGQRLQMWGAAAHIISRHPVGGVGPDGVNAALEAAHLDGEMTPIALSASMSQLHNEILGNTLRLGFFGLLAILAIYIAPGALFAGAAMSADRLRQNAGVMGVLLVTGYFVCGLTIETFNIKMVASFYAVTVAVLLAIARGQDRDQQI